MSATSGVCCIVSTCKITLLMCLEAQPTDSCNSTAAQQFRLFFKLHNSLNILKMGGEPGLHPGQFSTQTFQWFGLC